MGSLALVIFGELPLEPGDVRLSLIWGDQLASGSLPDYEARGLTPHPLQIAFGAVASVLGTDGATDFMQALALLSVGAIAAGLFLLGQACFSTPAGVLAALAFVVTPELIATPLTGTVDGPFLALILLAATLEVRRPRRGAAVMTVLAIAGLLRPEAWLFAGVYWLYLAPRLTWPSRLRLALLAAAGPVLWALSDLVVTGDPLYSLTATRDILSTGTLGRRTVGLENVPSAITRGLRYLLVPPVLAGGALGFLLAVLARRMPLLLPPTLAVVAGLWFVVIGIAGLPLNSRYLLLPVLALTLLFGCATFAWRDRAPGRERVLLAGAGLALVVAFAAFLPAQIGGLRDLRDDLALQSGVHRDLRELVREPEVERLLKRCPEVYAASIQLAPLLAYEAGLDLRKVRDAYTDRPYDGLVVLPATAESARTFLTPERRARLAAELSPSFERVATNRSFALYVSGNGRGCPPVAGSPGS